MTNQDEQPTSHPIYATQWEKIQAAGEEANKTGKVVECNGIRFHPDTPREKDWFLPVLCGTAIFFVVTCLINAWLRIIR